MFSVGLKHFKEWLILSVSKISKPERSFRYIWIISFCIENNALKWLIICHGIVQKFLVTFTSLAIFIFPHFPFGKFGKIVIGEYKKFKDTVIFVH